MAHLSDPELISIRDSVAWVGRLSDSLIKVGPLSIGIDGVLSWIPGVGEAYSTVAGAFILIQGARAGAGAHVILASAALMGSRTVLTAVPFIGPAFADVFLAHKWSARMIVAAIDRKLGIVDATATEAHLATA